MKNSENTLTQSPWKGGMITFINPAAGDGCAENAVIIFVAKLQHAINKDLTIRIAYNKHVAIANTVVVDPHHVSLQSNYHATKISCDGTARRTTNNIQHKPN